MLLCIGLQEGKSVVLHIKWHHCTSPKELTIVSKSNNKKFDVGNIQVTISIADDSDRLCKTFSNGKFPKVCHTDKEKGGLVCLEETRSLISGLKSNVCIKALQS